ncbi:MAG TPA: hypothetical protein VLH61_11155 [Bacteroidales bacterium]|nr:hypothetical protein [Bacteroidales bacterium]
MVYKDRRQNTSYQQRVCGNSGDVVNRRSVLLKNFVISGHERAYNPLLCIHANRSR